MDQKNLLQFEQTSEEVTLKLDKDQLHKLGVAISAQLGIALTFHFNDMSKFGVQSYQDFQSHLAMTPALEVFESRIQSISTLGSLLLEFVNIWIQHPEVYNLTKKELASMKNVLEGLSGFFRWKGEESFAVGILLEKLWKMGQGQIVLA